MLLALSIRAFITLIIFAAMEFITHYPFLQLIFATPSLFCLPPYCIFFPILHLTNATIMQAFMNKNAMRDHNYLVCLDHIILKFSCVSFIIFMDLQLLIV